jgi:hypothetical protein
MRELLRLGRKLPAAFRPATAPPGSSTVGTKPAVSQHTQSTKRSISSDDARGSLSPEEGSRGDTLLPMLVGGLVLAVIGIGAVLFFVA